MSDTPLSGMSDPLTARIIDLVNYVAGSDTNISFEVQVGEDRTVLVLVAKGPEADALIEKYRAEADVVEDHTQEP